MMKICWPVADTRRRLSFRDARGAGGRVGVISLLLASPLIACLHVAEAPPRDETSARPAPSPRPAPFTVKREPARPALRYEIMKVEDISVARAKRFRYRVRLSRASTEEELRPLSHRIIKDAPPHNGMVILYYLPDSAWDEGYTAGMADWWPNGSVGDALDRRPGDYSQHRLTIRSVRPIPEPKLTARIPLPERQKIFFEMVQLEDRGYDKSRLTDLLASKYGISQEAVNEISMLGVLRGWPMP